MANFHLIRDLCTQKKISIRQLADKVGIREDSIQKMISKGSTNVLTLEKIAEVLHVSACVFFDDGTYCSTVVRAGSESAVKVHSRPGEYDELNREIDYLKKLLDEKERTIQILIEKNP